MIGDTAEVHYYFAYGSNMNTARVQARIGDTRRALSGRLIDWCLYFDKASGVEGISHANVRPQAGSVVEGVLFELTAPQQIQDMDPFEGHPHEYCRQVALLETDEGVLPAWVYVALPGKTAADRLPAREYLSHLLAGQAFLSMDYHDQLAAQRCVEGLDEATLLMLGLSRHTPG